MQLIYHVIYALCEPDNHEIRYIGLTSNIKKRYRDHHYLCNLKGKSHKNNWLRLLLSQNKKAELLILKTCKSADELPAAEIETIRYYKSLGCRLINSTDGGEGNTGYRPSEETLQKMSEATRKVMSNPEVRKKISDSLKGRKLSEKEMSSHQNPSFKGRKHSDTSIKKMSQIKIGNKIPDEVKQKMSLAQKGKPKPHFKNKTWKVIDGKRIWIDKISESNTENLKT